MSVCAMNGANVNGERSESDERRSSEWCVTAGSTDRREG